MGAATTFPSSRRRGDHGCGDGDLLRSGLDQRSPLSVRAPQDTKLVSRNSATTSEQSVPRQKGSVYEWPRSRRVFRDTARPAMFASYIVGSVSAPMYSISCADFAVRVPVAGGAFSYLTVTCGWPRCRYHCGTGRGKLPRGRASCCGMGRGVLLQRRRGGAKAS
ncbi:hypothetical protein ZWY2020_046201 [Hordeum vulgare]|nr:hypothetical protein ZWY2020_046201 [Hordeum vulgare]